MNIFESDDQSIKLTHNECDRKYLCDDSCFLFCVKFMDSGGYWLYTFEDFSKTW